VRECGFVNLKFLSIFISLHWQGRSHAPSSTRSAIVEFDATMSQSAHQRRSFRGEAMPATWSFRLVPLRFRNLHAPSSFIRVGLLGSQANSEKRF
jgi:hypothetical protein